MSFRLIDQNFRDLPFCFPFAYINLVGSADRRHHLEHLRQVFQMEKWGLALNIAKCKFGQPTIITFLGHQVSAGSIALLVTKVTAITTLHRPSTVKELLRYLGMVNYYRFSSLPPPGF